MYCMTEADEIAANMARPPKALTFDEALSIVKREMPDESWQVRMNTAEALAARSRYLHRAEG